MLYRVRPIEYEDSNMLGALFHETLLDEVDGRVRSPTDWLAEMAQVLAKEDDAALLECSFVAELRQKHKLAGGRFW